MSLNLEIFDRNVRERLRRSPRELDRSLRRQMREHVAILIGLLAVSFWLILRLGPAIEANHPGLFWLAFAIPALRHIWAVVKLLDINAIPIQDDSARELLGEFTAGEIEEIAARSGQRLGGTETPNLYVVVDQAANAMAINSTFANFVPRLNAIYLGSFLFKVLERKELEAVLIHEMAHFHHYMSPLTRNNWVSVPASTATIFCLVTLFPFLADFYLIYPAFFFAAVPFLFAFNILTDSADRDLEYASDAAAAELVGVIPAINALLRIGDRAEIFEVIEEVLLKKLVKNPKLDVPKTIDQMLKCLPEGHPDLKKTEEVLHNIEVEADEESEPGNLKALIGQLKANRTLRKGLKVVRWSAFDAIVRDGQLDEDELEHYVRHLLSEKSAATHVISSQSPDEEHKHDHPSFRKRIVYLYSHYLHERGLDRPRVPDRFWTRDRGS